MKKILVPTDFSEQANNALDLAIEMVQENGGEIILLHVIEHSKKMSVFLGSSSMDTTAEHKDKLELDDIYFIQLFRKVKKDFAELLADPRFKGIKISDKIMMGSPYHAISEEIAESDADIIVMGTTGMSNWEDNLIGSTAEKVVRRATCPVITLRVPTKLKQIKSVVIASDFKQNYAAFTHTIKQFSEFFDAKIHLAYINTPSHFHDERTIMQRMDQYIAHNSLNGARKHIYCHFHEEDGILQFAEDYKISMIMMTTHGRTGLSRLLSHSIAEDIVNYSHKPVMTFNTHLIEN